MAENDLELGAEWAALAEKAGAASPERLAGLTTGWARMRAAERAAKADLDAAAHRDLAEERERDRRAAERGDT
jgi:hypothetical protein